MRRERQNAAGGRRPDAIEDRVDEVGEVPGNRIAVVLPAENGLADRGPAYVQPHDVLVVPTAGEGDCALRVGRILRHRLLPPEDAAVVVDLAQQPELLNVPDQPLGRKLIGVVRVVIGRDRDAGGRRRRIGNVAQHRAFEEIEIEIPALARSVLVASERDHDLVLAGGDAGEEQAPRL